MMMSILCVENAPFLYYCTLHLHRTERNDKRSFVELERANYKENVYKQDLNKLGYGHNLQRHK